MYLAQRLGSLSFMKRLSRNAWSEYCTSGASGSSCQSRTSVLIQKRHAYTGNLNSETAGDRKDVSTLWRCFSSRLVPASSCWAHFLVAFLMTAAASLQHLPASSSDPSRLLHCFATLCIVYTIMYITERSAWAGLLSGRVPGSACGHLQKVYDLLSASLAIVPSQPIDRIMYHRHTLSKTSCMSSDACS